MKLVKKEEKKEQKKDQKIEQMNAKVQTRIALAIIAGIALLGVVIFGIFRDFDAQGYVEAVLSQTFTGNVEAASQMMEDAEEEELAAQYELGIQAFTTSNITGGVEMSDELQEKYVSLCKDIFKSAKYEVKEAEKISKKEYKVPVEYQTLDFMKRYAESVAAEWDQFLKKVDKGETYSGTEDEIRAQMQKDFLDNSYKLLETSYGEAEYAEKETMIFTVKKNSDDLYTIEEGEIYQFIVKIMGLDEIQD